MTILLTKDNLKVPLYNILQDNFSSKTKGWVPKTKKKKTTTTVPSLGLVKGHINLQHAGGRALPGKGATPAYRGRAFPFGMVKGW